MIILDTNVVSTLMRDQPDRAVVDWLDDQPANSIWITAVTLFETRFGLELLPQGRRRRALETGFEQFLAEDLENRVLDFDFLAAGEAARIASERQRGGKPVDVRDTLIAGIVVARRATLATRNLRHFSDLEVPVISPWGVS